jgi:hypothetical protein
MLFTATTRISASTIFAAPRRGDVVPSLARRIAAKFSPAPGT